jgi:Fe-S-cluster containining protein
MNAQGVSATPACRRCGLCCQKGGPALHHADLPLLAGGALGRADLFTIRRGETVSDNVAGTLIALEAEIVKIASAGQGFACRFHDSAAGACSIHETRPTECRALFCEDTRAIEELYAVGRLVRADLIEPSGGLFELVLFHDASFPAGTAMELARRAAGSAGALGALRELARAEAAFRRAFLERTGLAEPELDFYFGRSLARICAPHGVKLGD